MRSLSLSLRLANIVVVDAVRWANAKETTRTTRNVIRKSVVCVCCVHLEGGGGVGERAGDGSIPPIRFLTFCATAAAAATTLLLLRLPLPAVAGFFWLLMAVVSH